MLNYIKSAFGDESKEQILQNEYIDEAKKFHGARAYAFVESYSLDREYKNLYIQEHITAQGFEQDDFLAFLAQEKGNLNHKKQCR